MAYMKQSDFEFYRKERQSTECACGKRKKPGFALCYKCYESMPGYIKKDLGKPIGEDYAEAYNSAVNQIEE